MVLLPKTHKEEDELGDPKTRPVAKAKKCMTSRPSSQVYKVVQGSVESGQKGEEGEEERVECISSEEMLHYLENCEEKQEEMNEDLAVASADVVALFPSLDVKESARIVGRRVENSKCEYRGVNYQAGMRYMAATLTKK